MSNKSCKVENCKNKHFANGYCIKHDYQMRTFGKIQVNIEDVLNCEDDEINFEDPNFSDWPVLESVY